VRAGYTDPQVVQVGILEGDGIRRVRVEFNRILKPRLHGRVPEGFFEVACGRDRRLFGAAAGGEHVVEIVSVVLPVLQKGGTLDDLAGIYPGHPSMSEIVFEVARIARDSVL